MASRIVIVDSYSTDRTCEIARKLGVEVLQNPWLNYATQFQWGLDHSNITTEWTMRIDADEYLTPDLISEINARVSHLEPNFTGILIKRQVHFMGKWIRHGGYYPTKLLRLWRTGVGEIEQRWMDEHVKLSHGHTIEFVHDLVDDNLNTLTWWTAKHNQYSTREAVDLLNKEYNLFIEDSVLASEAVQESQVERKRWMKDNMYVRMPIFLRSILYFLYRYFLLLGFLDGRKGLIWHFLQGFWYRFLVDAKIYQIKHLAQKNNKTIREVLTDDFGVKL